MRSVNKFLLLAGAALLTLIGTTPTASSSPLGSHGERVTLNIAGFGEQIEPTKVYVSPAGACSPQARHLKHWRGWGANRTSAKGRLYYSTGEPNCIDGGHLTRGKLVLSHVRRCQSGLHYQTMRFIYFNQHRYDVRVHMDCSGVPSKR